MPSRRSRLFKMTATLEESTGSMACGPGAGKSSSTESGGQLSSPFVENMESHVQKHVDTYGKTVQLNLFTANERMREVLEKQGFVSHGPLVIEYVPGFPVHEIWMHRYFAPSTQSILPSKAER